MKLTEFKMQGKTIYGVRANAHVHGYRKEYMYHFYIRGNKKAHIQINANSLKLAKKELKKILYIY